jgi:hypothetical protein
MEQGTKRTLIIGASILVGVTAITLVTRAIIKKIKDKKEAERQDLLEEEISGGGSTQQENIESQSSYNPLGDLKLIESYIVGVNLMVYPDEVNGIIMKLNNADLKKLADAWKKKYKGESLYYWLGDEYDGCGTWGFSNCYESSMRRLSSLGLR